MIQPHEIHPPRWPLRVIRLFIKKEYLEEIEGDMEEIFRDNIERLSYRRARWTYTWEIVKLFRPILIRNLEVLQKINELPMFKNYFKVSLRSLMKNPLNSFINVFGLSVAIALSIFGYAFARWTMSTDQFHEHKNAVYLTTFFADRDGTTQQYGRAPRPLGEMLRQDFTHIKKVCRVDDRAVVIKYKDQVFHERVRYTDPEFLEMFTFPLKWGTSASLRDVNSIILSEDMSIKYFGEENPIGQSILVKFDQDNGKEFKITGVAEEFPKAHTISFNFLVNFENFRTSEPDYDFHDWKAFVNATLIQVDNPADLVHITKGMDKYRALQNKVVLEDWAISSFAFEPVATLHHRSEYIKDDISRSSKDNYISIMFMVGIAVFMLILACFNYINIAIVTAAKRLKEIGVRKSIGATRKIVVVQFLTENIVTTFFALLVGLLLGYFFFIRGFEALWGFNMDFTLNDPMFWIFLPSVLLITSIASGIYPSVYISKFQVVSILKGSVMFGRKNPVTKVFLCMQLITACIFITMSVMFNQNNTWLEERSWGYDPGQLLFARLPDRPAYEKLSALMSQVPEVQAISGSTHHIGKIHATTVLHFPDREVEVDQLAVDAKYFETIGLELSEGRVFKDHEGSDRNAVIVNEVLVENLSRQLQAWENPVGLQFRIDSIEYEVIGVVKDFHNYSFDTQIKPTIFSLAGKEDLRYLTLKVRSGNEIKTYRALQSNWATLFPETPFAGGFQEDAWGPYYSNLSIYGLVWKIFSTLAVTLAVLGLYGLIRLNVEGRTKEFSIRKVLGAGMKNIAVSITNQYMILFGVALALGAPLGYMSGKWLIEFANTYHMPITFASVSIAVVLMILVLLVTVSTQVRKVLKTNPVAGLKVE